MIALARRIIRYLLTTLILFVALSHGSAETNHRTTPPEYFVLVTLDGVRDIELFAGLHQETFKTSKKDKSWETDPLYQSLWAPSPEARRLKLMPFFWGEWMKKHGFVMGNPSKGSSVMLRNRHRFSYPGYSEILTGQARDKIIHSNDEIQNPAPTLLEFFKSSWNLNHDQTAVFASWQTIRFISEHRPGSMFINAGHASYSSENPLLQQLSKLQFETKTPWDSVRHDAYTMAFCKDYVTQHLPRVLYLSLGETDDWAHDSRYDRVLQALHQSDKYLQDLWSFYQSNEQTRDNTCFIITTDHGRGDNIYNWMHHNDKLDGAKRIWLAIISPTLKQRGELSGHPEIFADQIW